MKKWMGLFAFLIGQIFYSPVTGAHSSSSSNSSPPRVVVTLKPLHSLVCCVMEGIGTPVLLKNEGQSSHWSGLTPSQAQKVHTAHLLIWTGPEYEAGLEKSFSDDARQGKSTVLAFSNMPGLFLRTPRVFPSEKSLPSPSLPCGCSHPEQSHSSSSHPHSSLDQEHSHVTPSLSAAFSKDGHLWLSPTHAKSFVRQVTKTLAALDPQNAPRYLANCEKTVAHLQELAIRIHNQLDEKGKRPYVLVHDFTQYFDDFFGTKALGMLAIPHGSLTPKRLQSLLDTLKKTPKVCVMADSHTPQKVIDFLKEQGIPVVVFDYLGKDYDAGPACYFALMEELGQLLCTSSDPSY